MIVRDLNRQQLDELKQTYVCERVENPSYEDLTDGYDIKDEVIFKEYDGINFTNDDFFCTCGK